jgi:cell division septum initiation protein DivIVA
MSDDSSTQKFVSKETSDDPSPKDSVPKENSRKLLEHFIRSMEDIMTRNRDLMENVNYLKTQHGNTIIRIGVVESTCHTLTEENTELREEIQSLQDLVQELGERVTQWG